MTSNAQSNQGQEKQPNIFSMPGNPLRSNTSHPIVVSGLARNDLEKSDTEHPGERQVTWEQFPPAPSLLDNPHGSLSLSNIVVSLAPQHLLPVGNMLLILSIPISNMLNLALYGDHNWHLVHTYS